MEVWSRIGRFYTLHHNDFYDGGYNDDVLCCIQVVAVGKEAQGVVKGDKVRGGGRDFPLIEAQVCLVCSKCEVYF